ncbi:MAG: hypothetical protein PHQ19_03150 [Candidatus Krumholzibacteria bacterium]|nr:hypothetical protein [Candidatus Krumholzibacteria bacterium]
MKQHAKTILILGSLVTLCAGSALAQFPDTLFLEFDFEGFGNLVAMSPPRYSGDIVSGDSRLLGGSWWIEIDDTGWPPVSDPAARWDYIFSTFFEYNSTYHFWTAVFDQNSLPAKPVWEIDHPVNGMMTGTLVVSSTFSDDDMDGVFDVEERMFGTFEGNLMVMKYGTGNFAKYCGDGAYNGALFNDDPANWFDDYVMGHCILDLVNCAIGTEEISWGGIKQLHR